jgi:hypothetical protein
VLQNVRVILAQDGGDQTIHYIFMQFLQDKELGKTKLCPKFQSPILFQRLVKAPQMGGSFALPRRSSAT